MKRTVLVLVPLTLLVAIPLAGTGLTRVAGSVLLGGGGLTLALMTVLALVARGATQAVRPAAPALATAVATPPKPKAIVVEVANADVRPPEIEEVAAFFVKAAVKEAPPAADDFAADELAFFAEGENQAMRASDSSPHWQLG